jgi:hypothetical protein
MNDALPGSPAHPFYKASNIISSCSIIRQPRGSIPEQSNFLSSPFFVQVVNRPELPYRYIIASARVVVRQNGVVLGGASAVVNPFSGSASFEKFKLIRSLNWTSITYDVVSNGVLCSNAPSRPARSSSAENSIKISAVPAGVRFSNDLSPQPAYSIIVGLQSLMIDYSILDANEAKLVGVNVQVQVMVSIPVLLLFLHEDINFFHICDAFDMVFSLNMFDSTHN